MSSDGYRDGHGRRPPQADVASAHCARTPLLPVIELKHTVVQYRDRPDRCTIFSPRASGVARLSTWLSADADALCPLEEWR